MADCQMTRTVADIMNPEYVTPQLAIVAPTETEVNTYTVKPKIVHGLPKFNGRDLEDSHMRSFERYIQILTTSAQRDTCHLKLFPFTLMDKAERWFSSLKPQSLRTWPEVKTIFLKRYFPQALTQNLTQQIQSFKQ